MNFIDILNAIPVGKSGILTPALATTLDMKHSELLIRLELLKQIGKVRLEVPGMTNNLPELIVTKI